VTNTPSLCRHGLSEQPAQESRSALFENAPAILASDQVFANLLRGGVVPPTFEKPFEVDRMRVMAIQNVVGFASLGSVLAPGAGLLLVHGNLLAAATVLLANRPPSGPSSGGVGSSPV
jgi:hypothetical protein